MHERRSRPGEADHAHRHGEARHGDQARELRRQLGRGREGRRQRRRQERHRPRDEGDKEVCRIVDLNLDGYPDSFIYYEADGKTERRRESDFDRDGRVDEISISERGQLTLKLRETNFDNKIDTWDYYEGGRLTKRERDTDGDGIIDQWWTFNNPTNPKCAVVASDRNADGKPDPDSVVDLCGEAYTAPKDPSIPTPAASGKPAPSAGVPVAPAPTAIATGSAAPAPSAVAPASATPPAGSPPPAAAPAASSPAPKK